MPEHSDDTLLLRDPDEPGCEHSIEHPGKGQGKSEIAVNRQFSRTRGAIVGAIAVFAASMPTAESAKADGVAEQESDLAAIIEEGKAFISAKKKELHNLDMALVEPPTSQECENILMAIREGAIAHLDRRGLFHFQAERFVPNSESTYAECTSNLVN